MKGALRNILLLHLAIRTNRLPQRGGESANPVSGLLETGFAHLCSTPFYRRTSCEKCAPSIVTKRFKVI